MFGRAAAYVSGKLGRGKSPVAPAPAAAATPAPKPARVRDLVKERKDKLERNRRDVTSSRALYNAVVLNYIDFAKVLYHTSRVEVNKQLLTDPDYYDGTYPQLGIIYQNIIKTLF